MRTHGISQANKQPAKRSLGRGHEQVVAFGNLRAATDSPQNEAWVAATSELLLSGIEGRDRPFAGSFGTPTKQSLGRHERAVAFGL
jgi:hypothetical protein